VTFLARTGARYGAAVFYRVNYRGTVGYIALDPSAFAPTHCISRLPAEPVATAESWNALDPQRPPPTPTQNTAPTSSECTVTIGDVGYLRPSATFDRTGAVMIPRDSRVTLIASTGLTDRQWTLYQVRVASGTYSGRVGYIGLAAGDFGSPSRPGCVALVPRVMAPSPPPPRPGTTQVQPPPVVPSPAPPPMVPTPPVRVPPLLPAPPPMHTVTPAPVPTATQSTPVWPWLLGAAAVAVTAAVVVRNT
jgi:hypothetical protein